MGEERKHRDNLAGECAGIYIHIPFCRAKCIYCDFSSFAEQDKFFRIYKDCLMKEIVQRRARESEDYLFDTIYIGGGTPSIFPEAFLDEILAAVKDGFTFAKNAETTIETNPESISIEKLRNYARSGINRISLGFQSLDDRILQKIGRLHTSQQAVRAFQHARDAGFANISIDLIAGLPDHTVGSFTKDLAKTIALDPEHISVYLLELDKETPLSRLVKENRMKVPGEETMLELYKRAEGVLKLHGFVHYEISNYCLPQKASRHNLKYWKDMPYFGFGSSAHSYMQGRRYENEKDFRRYIEMIGERGDAVARIEEYDPRKRVAEALFMGLRLLDGVSISRIKQKHGIDVRNMYERQIRSLLSDSFIEISEDVLKLTERGVIFSNDVFMKFI